MHGDERTTSGTPVSTEASRPVSTEAGTPVSTEAGRPVATEAGTPVSTTAGPPVTTEAGRPAWRTVARRVLPPLFSVAIVVAVFWYFLPQFTSISAVWVSIKSMTWLQILTLALLALWNQTTYFIVNVSTMPGLTYRQSAVATESSTAVSNTVPGGGAIGIAMKDRKSVV